MTSGTSQTNGQTDRRTSGQADWRTVSVSLSGRHTDSWMDRQRLIGELLLKWKWMKWNQIKWNEQSQWQSQRIESNANPNANSNQWVPQTADKSIEKIAKSHKSEKNKHWDWEKQSTPSANLVEGKIAFNFFNLAFTFLINFSFGN